MTDLEEVLFSQNEQLRAERDELRAELDALKAQKPVAEVVEQDTRFHGYARAIKHLLPVISKADLLPIGAKLYANPVLPAPSVPEGWLQAVDEALVVTHLGIASADDSYEDAKAKLNALISWNTDVATDPAVNGGFKLVPVEPSVPDGLKEAADHIIDALQSQYNTEGITENDSGHALIRLNEAIAAVEEVLLVAEPKPEKTLCPDQ